MAEQAGPWIVSGRVHREVLAELDRLRGELDRARDAVAALEQELARRDEIEQMDELERARMTLWICE